jgi:hypothetical protein
MPSIFPQSDAPTPVMVTTYNDPRIPTQGRAAQRGAMLVYVNGDGAAVLMAKQGDGPNDWVAFIPPPTGNEDEFLRADLRWAEPPEPGGFVGGFLPITQLLPIAGPRLLGNATDATGPVTALTSTQARGVLGLQVVAKTADSPFMSTSYADVAVGVSGSPTVGFDLLADRSYYFRFVTLVRSTNANIGPGLTVVTPTYSVFGASATMIGQIVAGPTVMFATPITTSQGPAVASSVDTAGLDYVFAIEGIIVPNANGRMTLQARIETGSSATITVRRGSFGMAWTL